MPVSLEYLSRYLGRLQAELPANVCFHFRRKMRVRSHGAGNFPDSHDRPRPLEAGQRPAKLVVHQRHFQAERRRLSMHAVGAAHARSKLEFLSLARNDLAECLNVGYENIHRLHHLVR